MAIASNYLYPNDPQKNLTLLAGLRLSDSGGTKCTTEDVYKKVPYTNISPKTLREISLIVAGLGILAIPFYLTISKVIECGGILLDVGKEEALKCAKDLGDAFGSEVNAMSALCLISTISMGITAAYAGARYYFQDKEQSVRFTTLKKEYVAAAEHLVQGYRSAKKPEERQAFVETAKKLERIEKLKVLRNSLIEVVRLTAPQADLLSATISRAANEILDFEKSAAAPVKKPLFQTAVAG